MPHPKLARLHPAELADLVEASPHLQGQEIIAAVQHDPELEADLFEELAEGQQLEFAANRDDGEIADLLARMESDDAADLVAQFDDERRGHLLELLPPVQRRRVGTLLGYEPLTAGGLMSPDFVAVYAQATQAEALDRVRRAATPADALAWIFAITTHHRYRGAVSLPDLVRADPDAQVADLVTHARSVTTEAGLADIARAMTDYDLTVVPVVDRAERRRGDHGRRRPRTHHPAAGAAIRRVLGFLDQAPDTAPDREERLPDHRQHADHDDRPRDRVGGLHRRNRNRPSPPTQGASMKITRNGGETGRGPAEWFTGDVYLDAVAAPGDGSRVSATSVHFSPGARTHWHTHPNGQTICVLEGIGLAQHQGGRVEVIRPGDRVFFEPGEVHWHGAAPNRFMAHLAIVEVDEHGNAADWGDPVTDEQYAAAPDA